MAAPTKGRWAVQLRLAVEAQTEIPEVWATLRAQDRAVVIERLAETMARAAVAFTARPGGEGNEGISDDGQKDDRVEGDGADDDSEESDREEGCGEEGGEQGDGEQGDGEQGRGEEGDRERGDGWFARVG